MNMSFIDKIGKVFQTLFSSFLSIELFILGLLLFFLLFLNIKRRNKYINMVIIAVIAVLVLTVLIGSVTYVGYAFTSIFKKIIKYIYFPSTALYICSGFFAMMMIVYSMYSEKLTKFKRIFNYVFFCLITEFYLMFVIVCTAKKIDLSDLVSLYSNDRILSIVYISNYLLIIWVLYTCFYHLFVFFKKKFDK